MKSYDVISGKIANDNTNATIIAYMGNVFGKMESESAAKMCINLLLPERLQDQFCFRTQKAISKLKFLKSERLAMDLATLLTVQELALQTKKSEEETLISFMKSKTAKMLYDNSTKLWWNSPASAVEEYIKENSLIENQCLLG